MNQTDFYGIKTQDLRNFLVKRFHHEKTVGQAFRFHGAAQRREVTIQLKLRVFSSRCIHSALITWP